VTSVWVLNVVKVFMLLFYLKTISVVQVMIAIMELGRICDEAVVVLFNSVHYE